jgi:Cu/Zn superoxide dismutase
MRKVLRPITTLGAAGLAMAGQSVAAWSDTPTTYQATLAPVPTNHATGSGTVTVQVSGGQAQVTVHTTGLLDAPHAMHVHIDGQGKCPDASAAKNHNGHQAISSADGTPFYGPAMVALTVNGDTSHTSAFAMDRAPSGSSINYQRTIPVDARTVSALAAGKGVFVVHGVDYDGSGHYDNALGPSEAEPSLPQDETAPVLCGALAPAPPSAPSAPGAPPAAGTAPAGGITINEPSSATTLSATALAVACVSLGIAITTLVYSLISWRRTDRQR